MNKLSIFLIWFLHNYLISINSSNFHFFKIRAANINIGFKNTRANNYGNKLYTKHNFFLFKNDTKRYNLTAKRRKKRMFLFIFNNLKDDNRIHIPRSFNHTAILHNNKHPRKKIHYNIVSMNAKAQLNDETNNAQEFLDKKSFEYDSNDFNNNSKEEYAYKSKNLNDLINYEKKINKNNIHAVLLLGGTGKRSLLCEPKQFFKINNTPTFIYSFNLFIKCNMIKSVSVVCDAKYFKCAIEQINEYNHILLQKKEKNGFLYNGISRDSNSDNDYTSSTEHKKTDEADINENKGELQNQVDILDYLKK